MLNFTVGPVTSSEEICAVGGEQVPYFRTLEFSEIMLENENLIKKFSRASEKDRVVFLTGSGTMGMEAAVINCFSAKDKVIIINGGSFGARFVELCTIHNIPYSEIKPEFGKDITETDLDQFRSQGYTGFIVNIHETSTGVRYNLDSISNFCKDENLFLMVDAISSFLADPINMKKQGIDVLITGSQKALACAPGVCVIVLSEKAVERIQDNDPHSLYLDLRSALKNGERGQTPFTPAVGILRQINTRLKKIDDIGGVEVETKRIESIARNFRKQLVEYDLPFNISSQSLSNAVTPLEPINGSAYDIFLILKDEYSIWVCPNGGPLKDKIFRVGHIGSLTIEDNTILINALCDLKKRNLI